MSTNISKQFDDSAVQAFNELIDNLIAQVELVQPDYSKKFVFTTDASDLAIGAVLTQVFVPNRSRHFRVTPRDKGVMSTCRWHRDALMAGRSRRGNSNDGYCDAGPQAMLKLC